MEKSVKTESPLTKIEHYIYSPGIYIINILEDGTYNISNCLKYRVCNCSFGEENEKGDTLYKLSSWDGGLEFSHYRNIQYCPHCGGILRSYDDEKNP